MRLLVYKSPVFPSIIFSRFPPISKFTVCPILGMHRPRFSSKIRKNTFIRLDVKCLSRARQSSEDRQVRYIMHMKRVLNSDWLRAV